MAGSASGSRSSGSDWIRINKTDCTAFYPSPLGSVLRVAPPCVVPPLLLCTGIVLLSRSSAARLLRGNRLTGTAVPAVGLRLLVNLIFEAGGMTRADGLTADAGDGPLPPVEAVSASTAEALRLRLSRWRLVRK
jgi:hypothetical protein